MRDFKLMFDYKCVMGGARGVPRRTSVYRSFISPR